LILLILSGTKSQLTIKISAAQTIASLIVTRLIILIRYGVQILAIPMRTRGSLFTNSGTFGSIITALNQSTVGSTAQLNMVMIMQRRCIRTTLLSINDL